MQPRWLISLLDEYGFQGHYYAANADDMVNDTQYTEVLGVEHSQRLSNDYLASRHFFETLQGDQKRRLYEQEKQDQQIRTVLNTNAKLLDKTEAQVNAINAELNEWCRQYDLSCAWVARANNWVANARRALSSAQGRLSAAEAQVSSCQSAYSAARSQTISVPSGKDSQGNTTYRSVPNPATAELAALESARAVRDAAYIEVTNCQAELDSALADLSQAERQKAGSECAINDCRSALKIGSDSVRIAEVAMSYGKGASTVLNQKAAVLAEIDGLLDVMEECVERQLACTTRLNGVNDNAQVAMRGVEQSRSDLVYQMHNLTHAIVEKTELLNAFDQPIFVGV
ncbi:hypothetical protein [Vibrio sp. WXL103]|uniref:hypothetical protein n=1 Tax=Vibrio sp. WXL103 TaxID=3450710 RepID=UPI003EC65EBB